jgi:hypothetical protein
VPADGALHVVSFDRIKPDEADRARHSVAKTHPDMMWLPITGLDRHTPVIGLRVFRDAGAAAALPGAQSGIQEAIYRPISDFATAD